MKILAAAMFLSSLAGVKAAPPAIDYDRILAVIAEVEGGKWGESGGPCQISYSAWSQHSRFAYQLSGTRAHCMVVLKTHIAWLSACIVRSGAKLTPEAIGTAWRFGYERARTLKFKSDYGQRVANLYFDRDFTKGIP